MIDNSEQPAQSSTPSDCVNVLTFGVGHGDCLLVEFVQEGRVEFRLLYDGGVKLPKSLLTHLRSSPRLDGDPDLDVVVLSHVDNDHQGGLHELFAKTSITIGEYWSPCLPAFERLSWLFAGRVAKAVHKAAQLEKVADARGIRVIYPMEDHVQRFARGSVVTVSIVSPARRLLKQLYHGHDAAIGGLLERMPLPLEWLIRGDSAGEGEEQDNAVGSPFDAVTATSRALLPLARRPDSLDGAELRYRAKLAAESEGIEYEPQFFGNSVLNDTSLVVVVDVALNGLHRRRIVLTGDQENWSYISSRYPMGLSPDVLKVPHHGGRVYLGDINRPATEALSLDGIGQFFIWMRPRVAVVSAKGLHDLPRSEFREAVRLVGATLVCPNKRTRELIFSGDGNTTKKSCYEQFGCCNAEQHEALRLSLGVQEEDLDAAACLQGNCHRGPAPVVVMQQRLIEPDETFVRWTSAEVRKQAHWLEEFLRGQRKELLKHTETAIKSRFNTKMISWSRIMAEAKANRFVQFVANPGPVLRYAAAHGLIWAETDLRSRERGCDLVAALSESEYRELWSWLTRHKGLLLVIGNLDEHLVSCKNWFGLLESAYVEPLMLLCAAKVGLPFDVFKQEVSPRLLRDLQSRYSGRLASLHSSYLTAQRGHKTMLHLHSRHTAVDDFFGANWIRVKESFQHAVDEKELSLILAGSCSVLPPFSLPYSGSGLRLDYDALLPFVSGHTRDKPWPRNVAPGIFEQQFSEANWLPIWTR